MSQKPKRSFGIIIRRFIAGFLLFSIVLGLIEDIISGNFSRTSLDGFALGLIIVFFLAFYSRKNNKSKKVEFEDETLQHDNELLEEIDIVKDEEIQISTENLNFENIENEIKDKTTNKKSPKYNPINDRESMFSRLFRGNKNRYG
tara:strand:+ start:114 stop:548 length:435 start_codon:yes stop_codon:yes gene_type:complete